MNFKKSVIDTFSDKRFLIGLSLKLLFITLVSPVIQENWFVPFVVHFLENPSFYPWSSFLDKGGSLLAFPYGPTMLLD